MNIKELMQRREQINKDITSANETLDFVDSAIARLSDECSEHRCICYKQIIMLAQMGQKTQAKLAIMLEQNVTLEEAKAIIAAQSEEPAAAEPKQEEPEQFAGLNLTEKEITTLNALIKGLYAEVGFTDVSDLDLVNETGIPAKSMRGVLSSLSKKGIIDVDTSLVESINKQKKMQNEPKVAFNSFINLAEEYYSLHPEWAAEIAENA
tara:strand:- start:703 stop:1326 length:624 start_codon:yes stop_codon:yes gene_type:complete